MRVVELARYNIPERIIESWISQVGDDLLPVSRNRPSKRYLVQKNGTTTEIYLHSIGEAEREAIQKIGSLALCCFMR